MILRPLISVLVVLAASPHRACVVFFLAVFAGAAIGGVCVAGRRIALWLVPANEGEEMRSRNLGFS